MKSTDQDDVTARAREARDPIPADAVFVKAAETDEDREERLARERFAALRTKPVAEMSAAEVVRCPNPWPSGDYSSPDYRAATVRHDQLAARKEEVEDEIAAARVLARKGLAPDPSWSKGATVATKEMRDLERIVQASPDDAGAKMALARAQARRGALPLDANEPDPRLAAWRKVVWDRVGSALRELPNSAKFSTDWPDAPTFEAVARIEGVLEQALKSVKAIRQFELEHGD